MAKARDKARRPKRSRRARHGSPARHAGNDAAGKANRTRPPRELALQVLSAVLVQHRAADVALADRREQQRNAADAALCAELSLGVLRWLPQLEAVLETRLERPLRNRDIKVQHTLLLGLYQVLHTHMPAHAAVHETVALARAPWAKGLVNAVLRAVAADPPHALGGVATPAARHAHPQWWLDAFARDWPTEVLQITDGGNARPPMTLRVNAQRGTREQYLARLEAAGLGAKPHAVAEHAIVLDQPVSVDRLPGFEAGDVSVQDAGAQLCVPLLDLQPGQRLLDACAAPGGKCAHALETQPALAHVLALDASAGRLTRALATIERIGATAEMRMADARDTSAWYDGEPFDRILVDAPCSGSGVIRRHPDIKLLRRVEDIEQLAERQLQLLQGVWPALETGGRLLYVTCSVLRAENDAVVERFAATQPDARAVALGEHEGHYGRATRQGLQVLPGDENMDGFYYAAIERA